MPPPVTIMCTWGWWVIADPQVCRTLVMPIVAPKCLGSAAIVSMASEEALKTRSSITALFNDCPPLVEANEMEDVLTDIDPERGNGFGGGLGLARHGLAPYSWFTPACSGDGGSGRPIPLGKAQGRCATLVLREHIRATLEEVLHGSGATRTHGAVQRGDAAVVESIWIGASPSRQAIVAACACGFHACEPGIPSAA